MILNQVIDFDYVSDFKVKFCMRIKKISFVSLMLYIYIVFLVMILYIYIIGNVNLIQSLYYIYEVNLDFI